MAIQNEAQTDLHARVGRVEGVLEQMDKRLDRVETRLDRLIFLQYGLLVAVVVTVVMQLIEFVVG